MRAGPETLQPRKKPDVFVPREQEQEYARKHGIEIKRYPNGAILIGMNRRVEGSFSGTVVFNFPTGAHNDDPDKKGAHHLMEHMIANKTVEAALQNGLHTVPIDTSPWSLRFGIHGTANTDVREFGIWKILPNLIRSVREPMKDIEDPEALYRSEREVVEQELRLRETPEAKKWKYFMKVLYDKSNLIQEETGGTLESVRRITLDDLQKVADRYMIPDGMVVSVYTEGDQNTHKVIMEQLDEVMSTFPRADQTKNPVDLKLLGKTNPEFQPGAVYEQHIEGITDGKVEGQFAWILPTEKLSHLDFASRYLADRIQAKFFQTVRSRGISYDPEISLDINEDNTVVTFGFTTNRKDNMGDFMKGLYENVKKEVLESFTDEEIAEIHARHKLAERAEPLTAATRFSLMLDGLLEKGLMKDPDTIKHMKDTVEPAHYKQWLAMISSQPPAIIIAGDLKSPVEEQKPRTREEYDLAA